MGEEGSEGERVELGECSPSSANDDDPKVARGVRVAKALYYRSASWALYRLASNAALNPLTDKFFLEIWAKCYGTYMSHIP